MTRDTRNIEECYNWVKQKDPTARYFFFRPQSNWHCSPCESTYLGGTLGLKDNNIDVNEIQNDAVYLSAKENHVTKKVNLIECEYFCKQAKISRFQYKKAIGDCNCLIDYSMSGSLPITSDVYESYPKNYIKHEGICQGVDGLVPQPEDTMQVISPSTLKTCNDACSKELKCTAFEW